MSKTIGITFTCSKDELQALVSCLNTARCDIKGAEYVEQLLTFLEETLANYEDDESE